jgi:hypothetical protein
MHANSYALKMPNFTAISCILIGSIGLIAGCATADDSFLDCSIATPDRYLDHRCPTLLRASEIDTCLSSEDIDGHACMLMDADLSFCDADTTTAITAVFDRSDVALDCAGGFIDHGVDTNGGGRPAPAREPAIANPNLYAPAIWFLHDRSLSNIQIENCSIRRTGERGISMFRYFNGQLGEDGLTHDGEMPLGHHDILLRNLYVENVKTGLYLGNYGRDIVMDNLVFDGTDRIALYVESGTRDLTIRNSVFANNHTREALAFDSAYNSVIENNLFIDNREGGANFYQNCGELKGQVCPIIRDTPANGNHITGNRFVDNGIAGLQVASRQGRLHGLGWCATLNGLPGRHQDTAQDNVVSGNTFVCDEGTALVVMDGPNEVTNNTIVARDRCVPFEVSTGGLGREASETLDGLSFQDNTVDSARPPRVRNLPDDMHVD